MRSFVYFIILFFALTSCTKNEEPAYVVSRSEWYLERINNIGGAVHLIIEGSTTGDKVTIETHGDGIISDRNIVLDSRNHFNEDVVISFSVTRVPAEEFISSTKLKIYKKAKMVTATLTSEKLKY